MTNEEVRTLVGLVNAVGDEFAERFQALKDAIRRDERARCAKLICPWCAKDQPHRQLAESSIGGPRTRTIYDLHDVEDPGGVGVQECLAARLWDETCA